MKLVLMLVWLLGLAALSPAAHATSCEFPTPQSGDQYADVVFEATAEGDKAQGIALLRVHGVYKGTVPARVEAHYGGMKGYSSFDKGKRYLVFGRVSDVLFVHLCGATHPLPAPPEFRQGPWLDWTAEKAYGPASTPGSVLAGAGKPPLPKPGAPPIEESDAPVPPGPAPVLEVVPPAPPAPTPRSSCGGCSVARLDGVWDAAFVILLAALVSAVRSFRRRPSCSP